MHCLSRIEATFACATVLGALHICTMPLASAADGKVYSGATCVQSGGSDGRLRYSDGAAANSHPDGNLSVVCPIVNDSSAGLNFVSVRVRDRHPTGAVRCTLLSLSSAPPVRLRSPSVASTGRTGEVEDLVLAGVGGGPSFRYLLACSIPRTDATGRMSAIESYFAEEP